MWLVIGYLHHEKSFTLVVQYDVGLLLLLMIQCYKVFMPFVFNEEVHVQSSYFECEDLF
jgi:hypothetical protein